MSSILEFLKGKKTYITAVLFGVYNVGIELAWWTPDDSIVVLVNGLLASFGFGFLRAGIKK